ncbi:MAG: phosphopyruvate hydratase [Chloroflexi bacterium]|nr:phosphopyruvate hydratase [Chloroflexota bacterium]
MKSTIRDVAGRRVWDSRGRPAVEAEVQLEGGATGRAIAPAGASTGSGEAVDRRDGGASFGGYDVRGAVGAVNGEIAELLRGMDALEQAQIDGALVACDGTVNRSRLGGNALVATSMAVAHAAAAAQGMPLWRRLLGDGEAVLPLPEIQIFGGGAHAERRVDVQDFMVVCPGAETFAQALDWTAEVYRAAGELLDADGLRFGVADEGGYWPAFSSNAEGLDYLVRAIERAAFRAPDQVGISLDIAASEFYRRERYRLAREGRALAPEELSEMLGDWLARYPIVSIEDPFAEWDEAGLVAFTQRHGREVQIVGDDYLVTNAERVRHAGEVGACNALLVKPNQAGTLTEALAALDAARAAGYGAIISARSGESEDVTVVHLAVGWGVRQLKVGSFARSERMAKWNEGLRIEEALGASARFAGGTPFRR